MEHTQGGMYSSQELSEGCKCKDSSVESVVKELMQYERQMEDTGR